MTRKTSRVVLASLTGAVLVGAVLFWPHRRDLAPKGTVELVFLFPSTEHKRAPYHEGMTLEDAIKAAGLRVEGGELFIVARTTLFDRLLVSAGWNEGFANTHHGVGKHMKDKVSEGDVLWGEWQHAVAATVAQEEAPAKAANEKAEVKDIKALVLQLAEMAGRPDVPGRWVNAEQKFAEAELEVTRSAQVSVMAFRSAIKQWKDKLEADPKAALFDRALANFASQNYATAEKLALDASDRNADEAWQGWALAGVSDKLLQNFAHVSLTCHPSSEYAVHWSSAANDSQVIHSRALLQGIEECYRKHLERGGAVSAFTIEEVQKLPVDTTDDAMGCAAAMAAWKALGHQEHSARIVYDAEWKVRWS